MSLASMFGWNLSTTTSEELPDIFPLPVGQDAFVKVDSLTIFLKILTDVLERTQNIPEEVQPLLWDNCLKSESAKGLVTLLSEAISLKEDLFLVYDKSVKIIRKATSGEQAQIQADYEKQGESSVGVYISFKNYVRADMIKLYSALEYSTVSSLSKNMALSKAIQIKIELLRGSTALTDASVAKAQAIAMANALAKGKDIYLDAKDSVETAKPDLTATKEAMAFLDSKRAFYLGMPSSYVTGEQPGGLGDSGVGDAKAIDRGLRIYYFSIIKPVVEAVFKIKTTYKSQDFSQISAALEAMKTFALTDDTMVSADNKRLILNKLLDLPEDAKGDAPPKIDPLEVVDPNAKPGFKPPEKKAEPNV